MQAMVIQNFLIKVLTTDKAGFTRDGVFNSHKNSYQIPEHGFQQRFSINVWAGVIGISTFKWWRVFKFFTKFAKFFFNDVPLLTRRDMWYLHDGAPTHSTRDVNNWLDANLENPWIGRNGQVLSPARSLDLNPCDFFYGAS
jgi:hypothetical protein